MTSRAIRSIVEDPRARWFGGLLIAAIVIGLLAAWLSRGEFKGRYAVPTMGADKAAVVPQATPAPPPAAAPIHAAPSVPPPSPIVAGQDGPPDAVAEDEDDSSRMARAIEKAARKALDRGEPVHWHKAGEEGYVVVSDVRDYGDRACRNVSATIDRDDGQQQSSSHLWCTNPDGDWAPAE